MYPKLMLCSENSETTIFPTYFSPIRKKNIIRKETEKKNITLLPTTATTKNLHDQSIYLRFLCSSVECEMTINPRTRLYRTYHRKKNYSRFEIQKQSDFIRRSHKYKFAFEQNTIDIIHKFNWNHSLTNSIHINIAI